MKKLLCLLSCIFTTFFFVPQVSDAAEDLPPEIDLSKPEYTGFFRIAGDGYSDMIGLSVAAGDINADGFKDILICAPYASAEHKDGAGEAYVIFGSADMGSDGFIDLSSRPAHVLRIQGENSHDEFGIWSTSGDYNGDGYDDFVVSSWKADPEGRENAGKAYIFFGSASIYSREEINLSSYAADLLMILGNRKGDRLGFTTATGDINNDGYDDVIFGAQFADPENREDAGTTYVIFGSENMSALGEIDLSESPEGVLQVFGVGYTLDYPDNSGWGVSSGDINGDGCDEVLIGARFADPEENPNAGETYVVFGSETIQFAGEIDLRYSPPGTMRISGLNPHDYVGNSLTSGDVNGDGFDEILINAYAVDPNGRADAGVTYIIFGSAGIHSHSEIRLSNPPVEMVRIIGENSGDHLGPASTGDINGDGIADIVLGALNNDPGGRVNAGSAYIILGSYDFLERADIDLRHSYPYVIPVRGKSPDDRFGMRNCLGDINGDGFDDAVISSHGAAPGGKTRAGEVYIIWGKESFYLPETHFFYEPNTGNNAVILISSNIPPAITGRDIETGDEIGIFTPGGICAGAGKWNGENLAITVWGDNLYKDGINGFLEGEEYIFKIRDVSEKMDFLAVAQFEQGEGVYHIDGISVVSSLKSEAVDIIIPLAKGWNVISSNVVPADISMESIWVGLKDRLVLVKNGRGDVYWPAYSINRIGEWVLTDGYQAYMGEPGELVVSGYELFCPDVVYHLPKNWSLISFVGPEGMSPGAAFADILEKLIILKNGDGDVFWPEFEIDRIGEMHRGEGYWIYLSSPVMFRYPASAAKQVVHVSSVQKSTRHFIPVKNTGNNATILVKAGRAVKVSGELLSTGDEIGIFTSGGLCVGAGIREKNKDLAITVRGDNELTGIIDGMSTGEEYRFVVWDTDTEREYNATAEFLSDDYLYTPNGLVILDSLTAGNGETVFNNAVIPHEFSLFQNFPNPFNPSTTITFTIPEDINVLLDVFNLSGQKAVTLIDRNLNKGYHTVTWDATGFSAGLYFYRIKTDNHVKILKMLLVK